MSRALHHTCHNGDTMHVSYRSTDELARMWFDAVRDRTSASTVIPAHICQYLTSLYRSTNRNISVEQKKKKKEEEKEIMRRYRVWGVCFGLGILSYQASFVQ